MDSPTMIYEMSQTFSYNKILGFNRYVCYDSAPCIFIPRNVESNDKRALQVAVEAIVIQIQNS
jgi:hypothetical protein